MSPTEPTPLRVLILEDDEEMARLYQEMIEHHGHEVVGISATVEEALAIASTCTFDLAFIDIGLRGPMIGIEGAHDLRERCPGCAIVFVTGYSNETMVEAAERVKPLAYLVKPVLPAQLFAVLVRAASAIGAVPSSRRTR